ncbi:hypothetical protein Taro_042245 [Colocasia esculenta]|uniref:non-specific serine/threonine protein kinase n=1 Tax=Colocasia esculenta TaxID=4460 RepID=A0A843WNH1_COLES|nr:hypothetical protein [Colocasia esculenta]
MPSLQHLKMGALKKLLSIGSRRRRRSQLQAQGPKGAAFGDRHAPPSMEPPPPPPLQAACSPQRPTWRCFTYEEISRATNGFHPDNLVGRGGYAEVYRGVLADGRVVAVKRLTRALTDEQKEKEFLTELGTVGHARHPNVSTLLGCSVDGDLHLVFEFSSHGSVSSLLHGEGSPAATWKLRHRVAVGTARGLHYLHKGCRRRIIHRDIKASNILLTADFEPQVISDFGLARWLPSEWTHRAVAPIEGTFGYNFRSLKAPRVLVYRLRAERSRWRRRSVNIGRYLAPEYFMHGVVDEKTDVFAFGVLLLELISGRKPVDGSHRSLLSWAKPHLNNGAEEALVDPRLGGDYDGEQLRRLAFAASLCVRAAASWRPSMSEVLDILEDGSISHERWQMPVEEEEEEEFWGFDELDECDSPLSSLSSTDTS